ncbi:MAG: hypothetical protein QOK81_01585 [Nitrososphaeraceae archaeon]|nr:hypothetical protein [Nitrososphaeraceae archaeon]
MEIDQVIDQAVGVSSPLLSDMFTLIIENQYYSTTASSPCFSLRSTGYAKLEWHFMQSPYPSVSLAKT